MPDLAFGRQEASLWWCDPFKMRQKQQFGFAGLTLVHPLESDLRQTNGGKDMTAQILSLHEPQSYGTVGEAETWISPERASRGSLRQLARSRPGAKKQKSEMPSRESLAFGSHRKACKLTAAKAASR